MNLPLLSRDYGKPRHASGEAIVLTPFLFANPTAVSSPFFFCFLLLFHFFVFLNNTFLGRSEASDVCRHAGGGSEPGVAAAVRNGRAGESGGGGDRSAVLGGIVVSAPASHAEPEGKRGPADEDEGDEE